MRTVTLLILLLQAFYTVFAQSALPKDLHFTTIDQKQGLRHLTVLKLHPDREGFLWVGTMDGLHRLDGQEALIYRPIEGDTTSISDGFIHGIVEDSTGNFWISTRNGGLNYFNRKSGNFTRFTTETESGFSKSNLVYVHLMDASERVFAGFFGDGLYVFNPTSSTFLPVYFSLPNQSSIRPLSIGAGVGMGTHRLTFMYDDFIYVVQTDQLPSFTASDSALHLPLIDQFPSPKRSSDQYRLFEDSKKRIWLLSEQGTVSIRTTNGSFLMPEIQLLDGRTVHVNKLPLYESKQGHFYFYLEHGLLICDLEQRKGILYPQSDSTLGSIVTGEIKSVVHDAQGNLWIGTWGNGISMAPCIEQFELFSPTEPIPNRTQSSFLVSIFASEDGSIWLGGRTGLERFFPSSGESQFFSTQSTTGRLPHNSIWGISEGQTYLWFATGNGIMAVTRASLSYGAVPNFLHFGMQHKTNDGFQLRHQLIRSIFEDAQGRLWIGYEQQGFDVIEQADALFSNQHTGQIQLSGYESIQNATVFSFNPVGSTHMMLGTRSHGIISIEISHTAFSASLLPSNEELQSGAGFKDVRMINERPDGTLWIATYGGGVTVWNPKTGFFKRITQQSGLPNNGTYAVLPDQLGFIWVPTNNGLARINEHTYTIQTFTRKHGLQNNEFNTGAWHLDKSGYIYVGGVNGFNRFHPGQFIQAETPRETYFTRLSVLGEQLPTEPYLNQNKALRLSYDQRFLELGFTSPDLISPELLRFQYRLLGADDRWIGLDNRRFVSFAGLSAGQYEVQIRSKSINELNWGPSATLRFQVLPPFYATLGFRLSILILVLSSLTGLIWWISTQNLRKRVRQLELEQQLQSERERISRDLHDNVGAQLSNLISGLRLVERYHGINDQERILELLHSLKSEASYTIAQLRETIWALSQPEVSIQTFVTHLQEYLYRTQSAHPDIEISLHAPASVPSYQLRSLQALNLFRVAQEGLQNALKHSGGNRVELNLRLNASNLHFEIKDNGLFKQAQNQAHFGLGNMEKRINELKGHFHLHYHEGGTEIQIQIPLDS